LQLWANLYQKVAFRLQAELRLDGGVTLNWRNTFADQDSVSTRKYFFSYYEWNPRFNTLAFEGVEYIPGDATVSFDQFTRDDLERLRWDLFPNIPFNPFPGLIPEVPTFTIPNLSGDVINEIGANSVSPAVVTTKNPIDYTGITSDDVALNVVEVTNEDTELFQTTATDLFTQWDTKATPIAADTFLISDSEDGGLLKKIAGISPTQILQGGATTGQVLKWDGSKWAPAAESGSKWTEVTNGIYRNGRVAIGTTTVGTAFNLDVLGKVRFKHTTFDSQLFIRDIGALTGFGAYAAGAITLQRTGGVEVNQGVAFLMQGNEGANDFWAALGGIKTGTASGNLILQCWVSGTPGINAEVTSGGGLFIGRKTGTALATRPTTEAGSLQVTNRILTGNFTGTTARYWKLGERKAATVALDTTQYITVEVDGTIYNLALATV
jgi:hypothetical protein